MRLPYVPDPPELSDAADQAIVERVKRRRGSAGLLELDRALLHSPPVADGWYVDFIRQYFDPKDIYMPSSLYVEHGYSLSFVTGILFSDRSGARPQSPTPYVRLQYVEWLF